MNALPRQYRGVGSGMRATFQNAGSPLSMGIFFSILIIVLGSRLPGAIVGGLTGNGVPAGRGRAGGASSAYRRALRVVPGL